MTDRRLFSAFLGKTILITGHTGFNGSWLSIWLRELGARVMGFSLRELGARVMGFSLPELPTQPCNFQL